MLRLNDPTSCSEQEWILDVWPIVMDTQPFLVKCDTPMVKHEAHYLVFIRGLFGSGSNNVQQPSY